MPEFWNSYQYCLTNWCRNWVACMGKAFSAMRTEQWKIYSGCLMKTVLTKVSTTTEPCPCMFENIFCKHTIKTCALSLNLCKSCLADDSESFNLFYSAYELNFFLGLCPFKSCEHVNSDFTCIICFYYLAYFILVVISRLQCRSLSLFY